jgi:hypothetical protein
MPTRIKGDQDFYVQNENDLTGSGNTGAGAGTSTRLANINPDIGYPSETAAGSDTGTFSLIRLLKRLLSIKLPDAVGGRVPVDGSGVTQPISGTVTANTGLTQPLTDTQLRATPVPVSGTVTANAGTGNFAHNLAQIGGASIAVNSGTLDAGTQRVTLATDGPAVTRLGDLTETAPGTDTASAGLNGRLQRIAQRITTLITLFPSSLGQKTKANSFAVTLASDQDALSATQSGTWTTRLQDGSGNAITSAARGLERALTVQLVDSSGTQITSFGGVSSGNTVFNSDLTLDTAAYAAGDSFCTLLTVTGAVLTAGNTAILDYIHIVDVDDVGPALRLYFFDRSVTLPANNAAWNVSDADMKFSRIMQQVDTGNWSDAGGNRTATYSNLGYLIRPNSGTSIFMAAIIDSATTHTAAGINISIGFRY